MPLLTGRSAERFGFVGIKVHRRDARISREICEVARAFALPVLYDVMGEVSICELLATEYPDVPFIIPHLGSFGDDWRAQVALIDHLVRHTNIYTDTSGVRRFDVLVEAVRRAGRARSSLALMARGCIPVWNWPRYGRLVYRSLWKRSLLAYRFWNSCWGRRD